MAKLRKELEAERKKANVVTSQSDNQREIDSLRKQLAVVTQERDTVYSNLANAESYIQQKEEELLAVRSKSQIQTQPQSGVDSSAKALELTRAESRIKSLEQDLSRSQDALKDRNTQLKDLENEVQRLKKEVETKKPVQATTLLLENEVTRLKAELENEKRKSVKAVAPQQPIQQPSQPTQPAQQNQQELADLKNSLNKVTQERD